MSSSEGVLRQAWDRASGQCECMRRTHKHFYAPCGRSLRWEKRGEATPGGWQSHQRSVLDGEAASNIEILCLECHDATF